MTRPRFAILIAMAVAVAVIAFPVDAQIKWTIGPYLFASSVTLRADVDGRDVVDRTLRFGSTLDETDFAGMGYFEGRGQRWGMFADVAFYNLGNTEGNLHATPASDLIVSHTEGDLKTTLLDVVGFLHPAGGDSGLDVFMGIRYVDIDQKLDVVFTDPSVDPTRFQVDKNLINAIAGIRYLKPINDKWDLTFRADAGAGDAEFTWNAQAGAGFWLGDSHRTALRFGYKHLELKFEEDSDVEHPSQDFEEINIDSKLEFSGPFVGIDIRF